MTDKPELHLTDTKRITLEDVLSLFRKLTGREPTAQEVEEARQRWASRNNRSNANGS